MPTAPLYKLEQEHSLELPLGYPVSGDAPSRGTTGSERQPVAVVLHAFYTTLIPEFRAYLDHIPIPADVFVSTDTEDKRAIVETCFASWFRGSVEVRVVPNRGRDIAPKIVSFAAVHDRYEYVLHLHTKSSPHDSRLVGWRGYLLQTLLGSPDVVQGVFETFARAPQLGMLAPQHIDELRPWIRWGKNHAQAENLAGRMGFALPRTAPLDFPSGSMFWARSAALRPLLDLHLGFDDFPEETGQTDGTTAHAIERLYFLVCEQAGFDWLKITARGELHDQSNVTAVSTPQELDRFLARRRFRLAALRRETRPIGDDPVITFIPPKPRRVLHMAWRAALGVSTPVPPGRRLMIALHGAAGSSDVLAHSVKAALDALPAGIEGQTLFLADASRALALRTCFETSADLVLLIDEPGLLHPHSGMALLHMSEASGGRAVIAACVPGREFRPVDRRDFSVPWVSGPAVAIPRPVYDAIGGYDEHLAGDMADQEFSQRARTQGFGTRLCPPALFYSVRDALERGEMAEHRIP